jgi:hypothetical protein
MATQERMDTPSTPDRTNAYTSDYHAPSGGTDTPEPQHYPEATEDDKRGCSLVTIFLGISAFVIIALILWRVAIVMGMI